MITLRKTKRMLFISIIMIASIHAVAQPGGISWSNDGNSYYTLDSARIVQWMLPANTKTALVSKGDLTPAGQGALAVRSFTFSDDQSQLLLFTNSVRVWRLETRGDYWVLNLKTKKLQQLGKGCPASTLMFAKFSPDGTKVAYVSQQNLYVEDLGTSKIVALTSDGHRKLINGTFDWVYEEEFGCRDGFQWGPDNKYIAFWQIDATSIRDYYMVNTTDSAYSKIIPVEYPTIGQSPSPARIGIVHIESGQKTWLNLPGDPQQHSRLPCCRDVCDHT